MDLHNGSALNSISKSLSPVYLIVAIGEDGAIGRKGDLIWKISEDLKHFKSLTTGHPVIMGRKTWESLPKSPLPNRRNIILTRQKDYKAEGAEIVYSVEEALKITKEEEPFIIGGAEIYKAFLPYITHFHITKVFDKCQEADSFLTLPSDLEVISSSEIHNPSDIGSLLPSYQFVLMGRSL